MKPIPLSLVVLNTLAFSVSAAAQGQLPTEAFLASPSAGRVVTDAYGNCVRTMAWSADRAVEGCGRIAKPAPVATPAPPPPPIAVAPPPPPPPIAVAPPPPPPAAVALVAAAKPKQMRSVTLDADALFAFDSAQLRREGQPTDLEKFAARARGLSALEAVHIVGHTDNIGPDGYNQELSERRAVSVKEFLVKQGVDPSKIAILGMGERSPVADNATREGRQKNRRVVIMFKGLQQEP